MFPTVYLRDVTESPAQHVNGDLVSILVFPVGCLVPGPLHLGPAVRHHAGHHAPDVIGQLVQVGHGGGVKELVRDLLEGGCACGVHTLDGHRGGSTLVDGLEGILDLVQPAFRGEDGNMTVKTGTASSGHYQAEIDGSEKIMVVGGDIVKLVITIYIQVQVRGIERVQARIFNVVNVRVQSFTKYSSHRKAANDGQICYQCRSLGAAFL